MDVEPRGAESYLRDEPTTKPIYPAVIKVLGGARNVLYVQGMVYLAITFLLLRLSSPMGFWASLFFLLNGHFLSEVLALRPTCFLALIYLVIFGFIKEAKDRDLPFLFFLGICSSVLLLMHHTGIVAAPVVIYFALEKVDNKKTALIALGIGLILPMVFFGMPKVDLWGHNFYLGNNRLSAAIYPRMDLDVLNGHVQALEKRLLSSGEPLQWALFKEGIAFWWHEPKKAMTMFLCKPCVFLLPLHFPLDSRKGCLHHLSGLLSILGVLSFFVALARFRDLETNYRFITVLTFVLLVLHAITFAETRFRLPLDPLLALLAHRTIVGCHSN